MNEYQVDIKYLLSESDVELKVIMPLISNEEPIGLGFAPTNIQTKHSLKKLLIDKGNKAQHYYPDFVLNINGIPLVVIEAKKPNEDLDEAFRQASLYASEMNRYFPTDINPCELIIACDGLRLLAGYWETAEPKFDLKVEDWLTTNKDFGDFLNRYSLSFNKKFSSEIRKRLAGKKSYKNPLYQLGGKYIQDQANNNGFGESISINYQHLFNPAEEEERIDIVSNAYVKVTKHLAHVDPIDKLIRKKIRPSILASKEVEDNSDPKEIIEKLERAHQYNNQVILLIGSVGSGKSTFTTYLKEIALSQTLKTSLCWVRIDLNEIEVNPDEIYKSIKKQVVAQIKAKYKDIDFDEIEFIKKLYNKEIAALIKGPLKLLDPTSHRYKEILVNKLLEYQSDLDLTLECYVRELVHGRHKNLIIVLDNCDKRTLEEQLLMFEVANWIKEKVKSIVFLPLRETTYDHYRNEKPLDTVIKDLIFRINPPSLEKVIYARIRYANRLSLNSKDNYYFLPNGWKVSYPSTEELYYLKSILSSLFQSRNFKKIITGLAGRNVRKGIEIFLDFCKSGHISDTDILRMKQTKGEFILPNHIISRVFMRGNRVYYSDAESRMKNLFQSDPSDDLPDPFIRLAILKWLNDNKRKRGPSGILGFHKTVDLIKEVVRHGHSQERVESEMLILLKHSLLISESQDTTKLVHDDLVSINPPGVIHLELLENIDYLSAVAENTWYDDQGILDQIVINLSGRGQYQHLSLENNIDHAEKVISYLSLAYKNKFGFREEYLSEDTMIETIDFNKIIENINTFKSNLHFFDNKLLNKGSKQKGRIVNIQNYGIFCEILGSEKAGLIHKNELDSDFDEKYNLGDVVEIEIKEYRKDHNKYELKLIK